MNATTVRQLAEGIVLGKACLKVNKNALGWQILWVNKEDGTFLKEVIPSRRLTTRECYFTLLAIDSTISAQKSFSE